jgi:Sortase domain
MTAPNRQDGGTPDGVPPFAHSGWRYWRGPIVAAALVIIAAVTASFFQAPQPLSGMGLFESEAQAGAFAQPDSAISAAPHGGAAATSAPTPVATATPTPHPQLVCPTPSTRRVRGVPATYPIAIQIASIGVDAAVELAGVDKHGDMQVPVNPCDVAWYKLGPAPGHATGDAVIDGHLDWWDDGPAVFWKLNLIRPGAEIDIIDADGAKVRFKVTTLDSLRRAAVPPSLFSTTGSPMLTLYTCAGTWEPYAETYSKRLFVNAVPLRS